MPRGAKDGNSSAFHRSAIEGLFNNEEPSICAQISQSKDKDMQKSRTVLEKISNKKVFETLKMI